MPDQDPFEEALKGKIPVEEDPFEAALKGKIPVESTLTGGGPSKVPEASISKTKPKPFQRPIQWTPPQRVVPTSAEGLGKYIPDPTLAEKAKAIIKEAAATTAGLYGGAAGGIATQAERLNRYFRLPWQKEEDTGFVSKFLRGAEKEGYEWSAYLAPREEEKTFISKGAGFAPVILASMHPLTRFLLGSSLYQAGKRDVESINAERASEGKTPISPLKEEGYALLSGAMALVPGPKGAPLAPGLKGLGQAIGKHSLTAATLNAPLAFYRQAALGTQEDPRALLKESLEIGAGFGLLEGAGRYLTSAKPVIARNRIPLQPKYMAHEIPAEVESILSRDGKDLSALQIAKNLKISGRDAKEVLNKLSADPDHPIERTVDDSGRLKYRYKKETPDAIQEPSPAEEVPRPPAAGRDIPEGGEGVRPGLEGEEIARAGEAKAQKVVPSPQVHTALSTEHVAPRAQKIGFKGPQWDPEISQTLEPTNVVEKRIDDLIADPVKQHELYASIPETKDGKIISGDTIKMILEHGLEPGASDQISNLHAYQNFDLFNNLIKQRLENSPGEEVFLTAGGQGSGKSTIAQGIAEGTKSINTIIDTPGDRTGFLGKYTNQAEQAGKKVQIVLVDRPVDEAIKSIVSRSATEHRAIRPDEVIQTKIQAAQAVADFKKAHPEVEVTKITNREGQSPVIERNLDADALLKNFEELDREAGNLTKQAREAYLDARKEGLGRSDVLKKIDEELKYVEVARGRKGTVPGYEEVPGAGGRPEPAATGERPVVSEPATAALPTEFRYGTGKEARVVSLETPEDQAAYQKAQAAHDARMRSIDDDPSLAGEENRTKRAILKMQSGKKLKADKLYIEQAMDLRRAKTEVQRAPNQEALEVEAVKATANGEGGVAQSKRAIISDRDRQARQTGIDLLTHGITNKPQWLEWMKDEFGPNTFSPKQLQKYWEHAVEQKVSNPQVYKAWVENPLTFDKGVAKILDAMSPPEGPNGEFPTLAKEGPLDNFADLPARDINRLEEAKLAKLLPPRGLLSGVLGGKKGAIFQAGHDFMTDTLIGETMKSGIENSWGNWIKDNVLLNIENKTDEIIARLKPAADAFAQAKAKLIQFEDEAKAASGSPEATKDFLSTPNGQAYQEAEGQFVQAQMSLADLQRRIALEPDKADLRVMLHAGQIYGQKFNTRLEQIMGPSELAASRKLQEAFQSIGVELQARGIPIRSGENERYIPYGGLEQITPEGTQEIRDAMAFARQGRGESGQVVPIRDLFDYLHRDSTVPILPTVYGQLPGYVQGAARRIVHQQITDKWLPAIEEMRSSGRAPKLAKYLNGIIDNTLNPDEQSQALELIRNLIFTKTLWGNTGTAVKHGLKTPLTVIDHGPLNTLRGLTGVADAVIPEEALNNPLVKKAMSNLSKLTGGVEGQDRENALRLTQLLGATKQINEALRDEPHLMEALNSSQALKMVNQYVKKANDVGSTPVRLVELWELGVNVLTSVVRAKDAGVGSEKAVRAVLYSVSANNFRGLWDTAPFQKTKTGKVFGIFQGTPTKIILRYAEYSLRPEAVDIYGTKNGVKLMRTILGLGALAAAGKLTDTDLLHKAIHTPYISPDERTGELKLQVGPLAVGEDFSLTPEGLKATAAEAVPGVAKKIGRTVTGRIPTVYGGSKTRYWLGLPKESLVEAQKPALAAKEKKRQQKIVNRTLRDLGVK